jgi:hypothetical protein
MSDTNKPNSSPLQDIRESIPFGSVNPEPTSSGVGAKLDINKAIPFASVTPIGPSVEPLAQIPKVPPVDPKK